MEERLQKFLANAGIASRRKAEELIAAGKVKVNGNVITAFGFKIDTKRDIIEVEGKKIKADSNKKYYVMLNKPPGYLTTVNDEFGRPTVMQLIKDVPARIFPVGRLDYQTEGLLLLTNDGDFAYRLTHPKFEKQKTYHALIRGIVTEKELDKLRNGILLEDGLTSPAKCKILRKKDTETMVEIIIHEGRKRQVRRMFDYIGHPVLKLKRVAIGFLELGDLKPGQYRFLNDKEVKRLLTEK